MNKQNKTNRYIKEQDASDRKRDPHLPKKKTGVLAWKKKKKKELLSV